MDGPATLPEADEIRPFRLLAPERPFAPVIFTSAHSGRAYSADLLTGVRLCPLSLRRSEDCFVDELFSAAPANGAPLLAANFPRAFCDANREAWELDPAMFTERLPDWVNTTSTRVSAGLGTIAKVVASGESIYSVKLPFAEAERRIFTYWRPFHDTLARLIQDIRARFGYCLVIDCHSMPSNSQSKRASGRPVDFVLGDLHGSLVRPRDPRRRGAADRQGLSGAAQRSLCRRFYHPALWTPADDVHVLQIEIARALYMNEARIERLPDFPLVQLQISDLVAALTLQVHDLIGRIHKSGEHPMSDVLITQAGAVLEVVFNRPEKKNALTGAMYAAVVDAFHHADADASIRAVLLSGTGDTFTSGNDIKDFQTRAETNEATHASPFLDALSSLRTPLVAAVNGAAVGVGTTMLAHADLVIAARSARFVMPFTSLGLVPEAASSLLFPRLVGHQRASALLLLGEPLDAETARDWGLVYQVVADAELMETARNVAARLAALPPEAVRQTKNLIKNGRQDVPGRIAEELVLFRERLRSPEAAEAFAAFVEKRRPDFSRFG